MSLGPHPEPWRDSLATTLRALRADPTSRQHSEETWPTAIAHANFPEQGLASAAVFLHTMLAFVLSALYLAWVNRTRAGVHVLVLSSVCVAVLGTSIT